uniref:Sas10 C-terminal domain-containing protein n=1 Tax=Ditylenchus dipsaci TaxID=166011 RepID=A0A915EQ38_9BILA
MLELEEEDAISRQKKLDAANNYVDLDFGMETEADSSEADSSDGELSKPPKTANKPKVDAKDLLKMSSEDQLKYFVGQDDQLDNWIQEYEERKEEIQQIVKPLVKILSKINHNLSTILLQYSVVFFLKVDTPLAKLRSVQSHPIHDDLLKFKKLMEKADSFVAENAEFVDLIAKQAHKKDQIAVKTRNEAKSTVQFAADLHNQIDIDGHDENMQMSESERRGITYEMQKNKGLTAKRKKGTEHARVKKRKQYDKALIRRRSQVPDVRREMSKMITHTQKSSTQEDSHRNITVEV